uniref:GATA binding protein 4 n=1 Tax=Anisakis simplex TaxID=6269 RepID=A0A0M3JL50_ANISI
LTRDRLKTMIATKKNRNRVESGSGIGVPMSQSMNSPPSWASSNQSSIASSGEP